MSTENFHCIEREQFLETRDPTGYKYAIEFLEGGWLRWHDLLQDDVFRKSYHQLEDELNARIQSDMIIGLQELSMRNAAAAKILLALTGNSKPQGRPPTKKLKKQEKLELDIANDLDLFESDIDRLKTMVR